MEEKVNPELDIENIQELVKSLLVTLDNARSDERIEDLSRGEFLIATSYVNRTYFNGVNDD